MITYERLHEVLDYNPETGVFRWKKIKHNYINDGDVAGCLDKSGYVYICFKGKNLLAHRLAFLYMEGYLPENDVDHINRNRSDNRWSNLREVSRSCNIKNRGKQRNNTSGVTGVCWHKTTSKWTARIQDGKRTIFLGYFDSIIHAAKARFLAELETGFKNCSRTSSAREYIKEHDPSFLYKHGS